MATRATPGSAEAMVDSGGGSDDRVDKELDHMLQEIRVALPGVQVLFAFLLTVPFTQRFGDLTSFQRQVFVGVFIAAAVATAFLIAPSAYHRLRWPRYNAQSLLRRGTRYAISGLAFLALALSGIIFLVTDVLAGHAAASAATAVVGGLVFILWFGLPLAGKARSG